MKYGQEYEEALANEGFPADWISSAVSYRDLKKAIKKVQQELESIGLDPTTLQNVQGSFNRRRSSIVEGKEHESTPFAPELWVAVNRATGQFLDAGLTIETKDYLARDDSGTHRCSSTASPGNGGALSKVSAADFQLVTQESTLDGADVEWTHVPLATVTAFFSMLDPKLAELDNIQRAESQRLESSITQLGQSIETLTEPSVKHSGKVKPKVDVDTWRDVFALYIQSAVFFSSYEQDHGSRNYIQAKTQLQAFSDTLVKQGLVEKFRTTSSRLAFDTFVGINLDILKAMRFQEINAMAVRKIIKKFDKHTALRAAPTYPGTQASGPFARSIARDMCAEVSSKVVAVVPQQDDYICPICYSLAWRPIRLGCCNSVYCIRCIIQLQRECKGSCPMCRQPTVMLADRSHIDEKTARYLMRYFPNEVKARQKANERAAGVDKYGEAFYKNTCAVM